MKKVFHLLFALVFVAPMTLFSQESSSKPKLVIGIVVDQMRYDYLTRYWDRYGDNGFKKLINEGFNLRNAHYNYVPTYTAVGHASIYTGTTPDHHGIIGNNWYDKYQKKYIYCVNDSTYTSVGIGGRGGQKSPYRMMNTTITDQLRLAQNKKGKVIGLAIKDRSAILPAGHTANAAYWYEAMDDNKWISSSYYLKELPKWVRDFNKNNNADKYLSKPWNTLYQIDTYTQSLADNNPYEATFKGEKAPVFPHDLPNLRKENGNYDIIKSTPYGNTLTLDFAKAAILGEQLGKGDYTDFLAISFSSTDYAGHKYGPDAVELEDMYLRFDLDIANLLSFLDEQVGKGEYTIFLTADHGAVQVPAYLQDLKIPAKYFNWRDFSNYIKDLVKREFGSEDIIEHFSNYQIFLNKEELKKRKLKTDDVAEFLVQETIQYDGIYKVVTAKTMQTTTFTSGILEKFQKGYNQKFSGDVILIPTPATISRGRTGTTHGSGYSYDTHIPIIFYGKGIKKGKSDKEYSITDIAPTLASFLQVEFPNGTTGKVIREVLK